MQGEGRYLWSGFICVQSCCRLGQTGSRLGALGHISSSVAVQSLCRLGADREHWDQTGTLFLLCCCEPEQSCCRLGPGWDQTGTHLSLLCGCEPDQSWSRSSVRPRSRSSSSSGAAPSGSLHPGPMSWRRCPGTSTPDTG